MKTFRNDFYFQNGLQINSNVKGYILGSVKIKPSELYYFVSFFEVKQYKT